MNEQAQQASKHNANAKVRYINPEWRDKAETPRIGSRETRRANTSFRDVAIHDARVRHAAGGLDLDQAGGFASLLTGVLKEKAGGDLVGGILEKVPDLKKLLG